MQGAEKARPWVQKAKATYVTLVDSLNKLSTRFGFKYVPLSILIDEDGRVVRGAQGTDIGKESHREAIARWIKTGAVESTAEVKPSGFSAVGSELRFQAASQHLARAETGKALVLLKKALTLDPDNYIIRTQIWAIENPERFYTGPVDYSWQKEQLQRERSSSP